MLRFETYMLRAMQLPLLGLSFLAIFPSELFLDAFWKGGRQDDQKAAQTSCGWSSLTTATIVYASSAPLMRAPIAQRKEGQIPKPAGCRSSLNPSHALLKARATFLAWWHNKDRDQADVAANIIFSAAMSPGLVSERPDLKGNALARGV